MKSYSVVITLDSPTLYAKNTGYQLIEHIHRNVGESKRINIVDERVAITVYAVDPRRVTLFTVSWPAETLGIALYSVVLREHPLV